MQMQMHLVILRVQLLFEFSKEKCSLNEVFKIVLALLGIEECFRSTFLASKLRFFSVVFFLPMADLLCPSSVIYINPNSKARFFGCQDRLNFFGNLSCFLGLKVDVVCHPSIFFYL